MTDLTKQELVDLLGDVADALADDDVDAARDILGLDAADAEDAEDDDDGDDLDDGEDDDDGGEAE